jgi:hypothetical protein
MGFMTAMVVEKRRKIGSFRMIIRKRGDAGEA